MIERLHLNIDNRSVNDDYSVSCDMTMVPLMEHDNKTKKIGGEIYERRDEIFFFYVLFRSPPFMHFILRKLHIL